jgi:hypothetical protein
MSNARSTLPVLVFLAALALTVGYYAHSRRPLEPADLDPRPLSVPIHRILPAQP